MHKLGDMFTAAIAVAAVVFCSIGPASADVLELGADGAVAVRAADHPAAADVSPVKSAAFISVLTKAAYDNSVSPFLLEALVWQESRWRTSAVSPKGAIGLSQLMPDTARTLGVDPRNPEGNLQGGARYLRQQLDRFGDLEWALAAYNAGPQRVIRAGGVPAIPETRAFVDAIIGRIAQTTP